MTQKLILLDLYTDVCASETQEGSNLYEIKKFAKKSFKLMHENFTYLKEL